MRRRRRFPIRLTPPPITKSAAPRTASVRSISSRCSAAPLRLWPGNGSLPQRCGRYASRLRRPALATCRDSSSAATRRAGSPTGLWFVRTRGGLAEAEVAAPSHDVWLQLFDQLLQTEPPWDRNGTGLSVLSALARVNVDPWQEAASLARMPRAAAVMRLTGVLKGSDLNEERQ